MEIARNVIFAKYSLHLQYKVGRAPGAPGAAGGSGLSGKVVVVEVEGGRFPDTGPPDFIYKNC